MAVITEAHEIDVKASRKALAEIIQMGPDEGFEKIKALQTNGMKKIIRTYSMETNNSCFGAGVLVEDFTKMVLASVLTTFISNGATASMGKSTKIAILNDLLKEVAGMVQEEL